MTEIDLHDIPTKTDITRPYAYSGDVNLEHGGLFVDTDPDALHHGYASAVRVTDLDSGCGFRGAVMVEHIVILYDTKRIREALPCVGGNVKGPAAICDALAWYGHYDPDDAWDGYRRYHTEIIQCEPDGPQEFDGWTVDHTLSEDEALEDYVAAEHL